MRGTKGLWASIVFVLVLVLASLVGFATGALKPLLGLDLEGGVSVILQAPASTPDSVMQQALENIRNRVDAFGVGEPQIFVSGQNIEVQLPGLAKGSIEERAKTQFCLVDPQDANYGCVAEEAGAKSALAGISVSESTNVCLESDDLTVGTVCFGSDKEAEATIDVLKVKRDTSPGATGQWCVEDPTGVSYGCFDTEEAAKAAKDGVSTTTTTDVCLSGTGAVNLPCGFPDKAAAQDSLGAISVQTFDTEYCVISSADVNLGCSLTQEEAQLRLQNTGQSRLLDLIGTTARLEQREVLTTLFPGDPSFAGQALTCDADPQSVTPDCPTDENALKDQDVWLIGQDGSKYNLGPVQITGTAIKRARAVLTTATSTNLSSGWVVSFDLTKDGSAIFSEVTGRMIGKQLAIVLDNEVISAPTVQSQIDGSGEISGSFDKQGAEDLATVLNAGALPVQLTKLQTLTVSATLGQESLRQGIVAGLVGLILLFLYLLFYYRLLGVVAWIGMTIWAILALALVSLAGIAFGYSLTLAGIAGLVISLGITADSYIVFFERLKDEVRNGKSARSAVQPAFKRAYRTIVAADTVTGIAAVVLYLTAVSSVRGFALTLGVATLLDLFVVYFFKRPTVFLIARSRRLVSMRGFGLQSGVAGEKDPVPVPVPVAGGAE